MQTKVFNVDKQAYSFQCNVTFIQNLDYIIQDANFSTGIITAKSTQTAFFWGDTQYAEFTAFIHTI